MKVGIKDISAATGFSQATISNALNRKKGVNAETAAEIFRVAKEIGYISETTINKIKFVLFRKNGQIIEDTPFFSLMVDGFEKECRARGYEMVMVYLDSRSASYEEDVKKVINDTTSAVVLLGTELSNEDFEAFRYAKCPMCTLDFWNSNMSCNGVAINNTDAVRQAVSYLVEKGHKEIGYLRGAFRIKAFQARANGFKTEMRKQKLDLNTDYWYTLSTTMDGAYRDMMEALKDKPKLPTAFFADNDLIAFGAMKALQESGYRIPEDVSLIGFDDLPFCEIASPRLTSQRVPKQDMGRIAVRRIDQMIKGEDKLTLKIQVCTEFVERDSVADIN